MASSPRRDDKNAARSEDVGAADGREHERKHRCGKVPTKGL